MMSRLFKHRLVMLIQAWKSNDIILSMPKTGSTAAENYYEGFHLHTLNTEKTTKASFGSNRKIGKLAEILYKKILVTILKAKSRKYYIYCRKENERLVSCFFQDFCYIVVNAIDSGYVDSRDMSRNDFISLFIRYTNFDYRKKWIESLCENFNLNYSDINQKMINGQDDVQEVLDRKNTYYFIPMGKDHKNNLIKVINSSDLKFYAPLYKNLKNELIKESEMYLKND